jgi:hypothetical protein
MATAMPTASLELRTCSCGARTLAEDAICATCALDAWLFDLRAEFAEMERTRRESEERSLVAEAMRETVKTFGHRPFMAVAGAIWGKR